MPIEIDSDDDIYNEKKSALARSRMKQTKATRTARVLTEGQKAKIQNMMKRRGINVIGGSIRTNDLLPFGKYAINASHLHKQKLGLKTRLNNAVKKYPIQKVSQDLAYILESISNQEGFDVSVLNDDDKNFLYELIDYAEVPVNLPRQKGGGKGEMTTVKTKTYIVLNY